VCEEYCRRLGTLLEVDRSIAPLGVYVAYTVTWSAGGGGPGLDLDAEVERLIRHVRSTYTLEGLKDVAVFRAYRDFFWRIGIDPTKVRPSSEALVRRCLRGSFPRIGLVVDVGNIASAYTGVPIGLYDLDRSSPPYVLTLTSGGEVFRPIGGGEEVLPAGVPVLKDSSGRVLHIYPHRDSVETAITERTTKVFVLGAGVPGVERSRVSEAVRMVAELLSKAGWRWCGDVFVKEST
jgi:DNA/RNA-binding domain of Phe-tRNA-synthetase-like protein